MLIDLPLLIDVDLSYIVDSLVQETCRTRHPRRSGVCPELVGKTPHPCIIYIYIDVYVYIYIYVHYKTLYCIFIHVCHMYAQHTNMIRYDQI